jgi:hypothetical protein
MNKKSVIPVTLIVIAVIGILLIVKAAGDKKTASQQDTTSTNKTVSTPGFYTSSVYDFSFSYPTKYILEEKETTTNKEKRHTLTLITATDRQLLSLSEGGNIPNDAAPTSIAVDIFPGAAISQTAEEWVKSNNNSNFKLSTDHKLSATTIVGVPAVTYSWDGLLASNSVVFVYKGNIIMISMSYITAQDIVWKDFASVIQSFKLK